ncbi:hypothetical protein V6N00_12610 [Tersicoccus sp. MR15.9]|uniref:hypothetical protein n=1 Tax=Tersicoccus mangrovi TaxID=3121635 RepID=UPI002FE55B74
MITVAGQTRTIIEHLPYRTITCNLGCQHVEHHLVKRTVTVTRLYRATDPRRRYISSSLAVVIPLASFLEAVDTDGTVWTRWEIRGGRRELPWHAGDRRAAPWFTGWKLRKNRGIHTYTLTEA